MTTNDIVKIRKPQTRLKRRQFALRLHRKDEENCTRSIFLHLQLILAFISSKLIFPYKVYNAYIELGLPVLTAFPRAHLFALFNTFTHISGPLFLQKFAAVLKKIAVTAPSFHANNHFHTESPSYNCWRALARKQPILDISEKNQSLWDVRSEACAVDCGVIRSIIQEQGRNRGD